MYKLPKRHGSKARSPTAGKISQRVITAPVSSRPSPTGERSKDQSGHYSGEGQRSNTASTPIRHREKGHPSPHSPVLEDGLEDEAFRSDDEGKGLQGDFASLDEAVADFDVALRDHRNKRRGLLSCLATNVPPEAGDTAASTWLDGESMWTTVNVDGGVDGNSLRVPPSSAEGEEYGMGNGIDGRDNAVLNQASKLAAHPGKIDQSQSSQQDSFAEGGNSLPERSCDGETAAPPDDAKEHVPPGEWRTRATGTEPGPLLEVDVATPSHVAAEQAAVQENERGAADIWTQKRKLDPELSPTKVVSPSPRKTSGIEAESPLASPHQREITNMGPLECPPCPFPPPTAGDATSDSLGEPSEILQTNRGKASRASTSLDEPLDVQSPSDESTPPVNVSTPPKTEAAMTPIGDALCGVSAAGSVFGATAAEGATDAALVQTTIAPTAVAAMKSPDVVSAPAQRTAGDWMKGSAAPDGRPPAPLTVAKAEAQLAERVETLQLSRLAAEREKREDLEERRTRKFGREHADRRATFAEEDQRLLEQEEKRLAEVRKEADLGRLQRGAEFEEADDSIVDAGAANKPTTTTAVTRATAATVVVTGMVSANTTVGVPMPVRGMRPQHYDEAEDLPNGVRQAAAPRPAENVLDELAGLESRAKAAGGGMSIGEFERVEQRQRARQVERLQILHGQTAEEKEAIMLEMTVRLQMFARCSIARIRVGRLRKTSSFSKEKVR